VLDSRQRFCDNHYMENNWTDAPFLYIHFKNLWSGGDASLKMVRVFRAFDQMFKGIPGTLILTCNGFKSWLVPGYKCAGCGKTFFVSEANDLRHECCSNRGVISDNRSMGVLDGIIA